MDVSELVDSVDILDYISQYAEFTEKNGEFWALSPLKEESTPSFSIRRETNQFFDFSSGVGGNLLTFIMRHDHCGYKEAIEKLKEYAGYEGRIDRKHNLSVVEVAKRFSAPKKRNKEAKHTDLPDDYMDRYEKRADKLAIWENEGISRESLDKFQVCYDSFSDRLVYPVRDARGKIVNVCGRALSPDWKERGLRKYTYFMKWGDLKVIYGLYENMESIMSSHEIVIFEGCKSVLLADTYGIHNTGAILTSHLNPNQLNTLIKLQCDVVFALDKDVTVREDRNIERLKQFVNVSYIWDGDGLLDEKDSPIDKGIDVWRTLYEGRLSWQ